jgi:hypothetical protein
VGKRICTIVYDDFGNEYEEEPQIKESWVTQRDRLETEREEATTLFFQKYGQDLRWRHLGYLTPDMRNPLFVCEWCKAEAAWYMRIPAKTFWCADCAKELRKEWQRQYRAHRKWKDGAHSRMMQAACKK